MFQSQTKNNVFLIVMALFLVSVIGYWIAYSSPKPYAPISPENYVEVTVVSVYTAAQYIEDRSHVKAYYYPHIIVQTPDKRRFRVMGDWALKMNETTKIAKTALTNEMGK